jgi:hypothetical protein
VSPTVLGLTSAGPPQVTLVGATHETRLPSSAIATAVATYASVSVVEPGGNSGFLGSIGQVVLSPLAVDVLESIRGA